MRQKIVAGNWKMNGSLLKNKALLSDVVQGVNNVSGVQCVVCAPFPYLAQLQQELAGSRVAWGAQNMHQAESGAYTGEVSAAMLNDFSCRYVILGHSERRELFAESNELVAQKYVAAQEAGLIPILCVGETLEQRESGVTEQVVGEQLDAVINAAGVASLADAVIAYEPVWAIGTGKTASAEQAQAVHAFIRQRIAAGDAKVAQKVSILYGGSVKPGNAEKLFSMDDIDGGLIGGASLKAEDFLAICQAA